MFETVSLAGVLLVNARLNSFSAKEPPNCDILEFKLSEVDGSILAIRVIARLEYVLRVQLPLGKLFELPTISQMAEFISEVPTEQETGANLEKLLQELQGLSEQEVEHRLAEYQRRKGVRREG